tara:strand:- start:550 stop:1680 length:1131 start_codon:yes stop_codon:yes gene_type:complete
MFNILNLLLKKIKYTLIITYNLFNFSTKKIKNSFYSESLSYQKFSYLIIKTIIDSSDDKVFYISSDINDKINLPNVYNIFIGDGFLKRIFFLVLNTENLYLTLTDLDNHFLKKTNKIKNYIYYFHSPISTFKAYTETAFDNYDIILSNGIYQENELKFAEKLYRKQNKKIVNTGYFYFDYLKNKNEESTIQNEILVAPSWNYDKKFFINEKLEILFEKLLTQKDFKIRFRPHPEIFKRSKYFLDSISEKYKSKNFFIDYSSENIEALLKSKYIFTDFSGIAIEYILVFKKPVIYFDRYSRVHNKKYKDFINFKTMEDEVRDNFGTIIDLKNINNISEILKISELKMKDKIDEIELFKNKNFSNFGRTSEEFKKIYF